jgi:hypothetical protein
MKILLLDTSFSAKPIYDALLKTGEEVFVIGGNPDDFLAKIVKNYIKLDYSMIDEVQTKIRQLGITHIVPGGNDLSYKVCSELNIDSQYANIDTIENYQIINDKAKFRNFGVQHELHVPGIVELDDISNHLPVIFKPVDAYSGHGMTVLNTSAEPEVRAAVEAASQSSVSGKYIIEEFVSGQLFSHSAFITDGNIDIDFIVKEYCFVNSYAVDTSHVVYDFDQTLLEKIRQDINKMVKALDLVDGLIHTQFILRGDSFWLIEITRRCPGDLYSKLIELSTGFPYAEFYARPFIEKGSDAFDQPLKAACVVRHTATLREGGIFNALNFQNSESIIKYVPLALAGDNIQPAPQGRIGILYTHSESESKMNQFVDCIKNKQFYTVG